MSAIDRLRQIMVRLRDPAGGCPWDREQDWASIAPHTIEEAYELADAIARGEPEAVQRLRAADLAAILGDRRIERHILRLEWRDAHAAALEDAAQRGDQIEAENLYQHAEHCLRQMRDRDIRSAPTSTPP